MDQSRQRFNQRRLERPATLCRRRDFVLIPRRPDRFPVSLAESDELVDVEEVGNVDLVRFGLGFVVVPPPTSPGS